MDNRCISNLNKTKTKEKNAFIALLEANIYSRQTISVTQLFTFWESVRETRAVAASLRQFSQKYFWYRIRWVYIEPYKAFLGYLKFKLIENYGVFLMQ